jgi:cytochrome c551/c552
MSDRAQWKINVTACLIALAATIGCKKQAETTTTATAASDTTATPAHTGAPAVPVRLDQGWSAQDAQKFYYTPQGSQLIPYTWFLALEVENGETLFRDNGHMDRLGYITSPPDPQSNPDGLPVGFVGDSGTAEPMLTAADDIGSPAPPPSTGPAGSANGSTKWLGITCAACHTAELRHGGKSYRIDGGAAMSDHESFAAELAKSLDATHRDDAKFTRFAKRVLAASYSDDTAKTLRKDVADYSKSLNEAVARNAAPNPYGLARLDAFGAIFNQVVEVALAIPANHGTSDAPVSYPFLWETPALDWVQWNGSVNNPLGRNVGEVMGVYGNFTFDPGPKQFSSSVNLRNLYWMEQQVARLSAPKWPEQDFGAIDAAKVEVGKALYAQTCVKCHFVRDDKTGLFPMTPKEQNQFGKQFIRTVMIPVQTIGTDPVMIKNFGRLSDPGVLRPFLPANMQTAPKVPAATLLGVGDGGVIKRAIAGLQPPASQEELVSMNGFRIPATDPPNPLAYKARPLDGIWATAPFLHSGAVPNLYQLLQPAKDRVKTFHVGSREFDPVDVGLSTQPEEGSFEFNTQLPGNSNAGHEGLYYTQIREGTANRDFTEAERRALIEYMKTLR